MREFVARADVVTQFQSLGISAASAQERVNAMTQDEINRVAGKIDSLPAAGMSGWGWGAVVVVVGLIIYFAWYRT